MRKMNLWAAAAVALGIGSGTAFALPHPVTIEDQGSFMAGGVTITAPGEYVDREPTNFDGETLHGDAAYVFWQRPVKAKKSALVFLHGYGQSGKTWETTPDGRDGFQNISSPTAGRRISWTSRAAGARASRPSPRSSRRSHRISFGSTTSASGSTR